ncbi:MAG: hypothetical protein HY288_06215 [Planctomycetia bacterium]|nr:hypothetical protein [Planctomycetia bacterium]
MAVSEASHARSGVASIIFERGYRIASYFGLMSVFASLIYGFRYNPEAGPQNYLYNLLLYIAFIVPHLVLTRAWWKRAVWGDPAGNPRERQVYITLTLITWFGLLMLHWGVPGFSLAPSTPVRFAGLVGCLWCVLLFFQGATPAALDGLLGVPGTVVRYSHGSETPLFTEGPDAQVRHPMYRAVILMGICAILAARGDDYRRYCEQTPYRIFRGIW